MPDLNVTLIQTELVWENISANLSAFDRLIDTVPPASDLIILPEMFTTGFSMKPEPLAQEMDGSSVHWILGKAAERDCDMVGSVIIRSENGCYNRLLWAKPDGSLHTYDKKHLFRMAGEEKVYRAGSELLTVSLKGWRIRPFICYDLRFPIWTRNIDNQYDVALFVANWPEPRSAHWQTLLMARAIENQSYVVGVNRVGTDGNAIAYSGDSCVVTPLGERRLHMRHMTGIQTVTLSAADLKNYRESFPAWMDADGDMIQ
ncbi:MAG: amidohydrolase [Deltaproteobacteria bacterium]|nr:amidohydrolase [Deltaproteobacteria bacterium]